MEGTTSVLQCCECVTKYNRHDRCPVALPVCGHTFCRQCLVRIHRFNPVLKCPNCRAEHVGPHPERLPANNTLLDILEEQETTPQSNSEEDQSTPPTSKSPKDEETRGRGIGIGVASVLGAGALIASAPFVLTAAGFTAGGVAAGSLAASMMSSAAVANGGAIAAGSAVAVLQLAGAAGIGAAAMPPLEPLGLL
ncbi:hypothetical protein Pmani_006880 [Petrolisthes manimaculis]|uniref:RING-type domain-containing protein n=1 Tax=Petrolisthes manimaculis TaxID=1843537 RepID=A0AAE1Q9H1_9EUCA|nr:hypothetical protein Pmani_006880 [Petrolisthes manimaculis]